MRANGVTLPMKPPTRENVRIFPSAADFRAWLEANHNTATELWVGSYKKGVPKTSMTYPEAVEEALCFGWIDGQARRIDDEVSALRYTPRRRGSTWSVINVDRMRQLIASGRAHHAGIAAFEARRENRTGIYSYENRPADLPDEFLARLRAVPSAWEWWQAQRPSYRRAATWWVISAKQPATRERRFEQLVADCAAERPIKQQTYGKPKTRRGRSHG